MTRKTARRASAASGKRAALREAVSHALAATEPLAQLQQHTACNICYDTLSVSLSLPCFHSFCSLCIRRCLHFTPSCPLCHAPASVADLRPNFALSQIALLVAALQPALEHTLEQAAMTWAKEHGCAELDGEAEEEHIGDGPPDKAAAGAAAVAAASTAAAPASSSSAGGANSAVPAATAKVECPCCGLSIVAARINRHLDDCLGKESNQQAAAEAAATAAANSAVAAAAAAASSNNARMPFPVYNILSEKQLRKLLSDLGFPSSGAAAAGLDQTRESLVRRHREFVLRHNSELDASSCGLRAAVPDAALVKDIVRKEKARASVTHGRQAKQSLLNAFTSEGAGGNGAPAHSAAGSSTPAATDLLMAASNAATAAAAGSSRKRSRRDAAAGSSAPRPPPRASTRNATPVLDLSEDANDDALMAVDPPAVAASESTAPASPVHASSRVSPMAEVTTLASSTVVPSSSSAPTSAASSVTPAASSSSSSDPYAVLIATYEAKHGKRKRWKRRWGVDASLYPATETIVLDDSAQEADATATDDSPAASSTKADSQSLSSAAAAAATAASPAPAPSASASSPKAVYSLFHAPGSAVATAATSTAAAAQNNHGGGGNNSHSSGGSSSGSSSSSTTASSSSSGSGVVRVSKVLCSNCRATCRGSFPLGASVLCPKCRPAWTMKAQVQAAAGEDAPPAPLKPVGWMAKAQQQQQQQQQRHSSLPIPPAPANSVAAIVPAPAASTSASAAASAAALSTTQRQAIEERRAAALAKLHKQQHHAPVADSTASAAPTAEVGKEVASAPASNGQEDSPSPLVEEKEAQPQS